MPPNLPPTPPLTLEPWEAALILRMRKVRKNGIKSVLVHLSDTPGFRLVGNLERLVDIDAVTEYPIRDDNPTKP